MHGLPAFLAFLRLELRMRIRQPAPWIFFVLFAALGFGAMTSDAVQIGGGSGQTAINSPYVITQMHGIMSVLGIFVVTGFAAGCVVRDFDGGEYQLFYTKPIRARDYLLGRFAGGLIASIAVLGGTSLGLYIGSYMPWLEADRMVDISLLPYASALIVFMIPNMLVMGAIFFAVATLSRRMLWAYVAVAAFFVFFAVSQAYIADLDNEAIAALTDPFGMSAMQLETRYWTPAERNEQLLWFGGTLGLNRVIWIGVAIGILGMTLARFRLKATESKAGRRRVTDDAPADRDIEIPKTSRSFDLGTNLRLLAFQSRVELRSVVTSTAYIVLALFAALNVYGSAYGTIDQLFGTSVYPVTGLMVRLLEDALALFMLIVITFYAGELVWKERKVGLSSVYDATPVPNWVPLCSKIAALIASAAILSGVGVITAMLVQVIGGYTDFEIGLYAKAVFGVQLVDWAILCVLAVFFQVIANHKYAGFGLMVLHFVLLAVLPSLDFDHRLYRFGSAPDGSYSDMNGFGHFVAPMGWLRLYWGWASLALVLIANLLWVRGTDARLRQRWKAARHRTTHASTAMLAVAVLGFFGTGAFIYYNTNVLNDYKPGDEQEDLQVLYEERYKQYEHLPQPRLIAVDLEADLFPAERRLDIRGDLTLRNETDTTIDTLHVQINKEAKVHQLSLDELATDVVDEELGYRIYRLDPPLAPKAELVVQFDATYQEVGFPNSGSNTAIVYNGTFVHNGGYVPSFGYNAGAELGDRNERRERGLPERPRMPPLEDERARMNTYISSEGDWIDFKATVSTSDDQIALAPGYLVKEWQDAGRRYFRYEMDAPILNFYAFLSADYTVKRDKWNDVEIAIYYHEPHDYNVDRMIEAVKKSLDYYTANFSPYQHRQVRIVEFPRYASFAQSLPNIIPYSESIGFIADLRDEDDLDYVFYVTAHEVAHQWWAHQVIGGNVQGSTVMSETLSQYSALMVMEKEYGKKKMEKFLKYELNQYLQGRSTEQQRELPLVRVENQGYIHYNKGSLVMYALREYLGEDTVNRALAAYIKKVGFQRPPFTTSLEFVEALREVTPPEYAYLIEDLFETITLYDNRVESTSARALGDGRHEVTLSLKTQKLRADETGAEEPIDIDDWVEVGVFGEDDDGEDVVLYLEKHRISESELELTVVVDGVPTQAGVDPNYLLIDRNPEDNRKAVDVGE